MALSRGQIGLKCQAEERGPPASGSPAEVAHPGLHCGPLFVPCTRWPLPRWLARWPAMVSRAPPSPLQAQSCTHWMVASAARNSHLPASPQHVVLPFPSEKVPVPEPKPCQEFVSSHPRGHSGHGQAQSSPPREPSQLTLVEPRTGPFPPPEGTALPSSRNPD